MATAKRAIMNVLDRHEREILSEWMDQQLAASSLRADLMKGDELREIIRTEMHERLLGPAAPYNLEAANGVSCTTATVAAAALGIRDLSRLTAEQRRDIQRAHLLVAMYNAMQPGVFAVSGWDLVGALTVPADSVKALLADGDTRWINRGAYDLLGTNPRAAAAGSGLPRAPALYGPLPEQLRNPASFARQLQKMLRVRAELRLHEAEQVDVPAVRARGLVVMVHRLLAGAGTQVTAMNFGRAAVNETVAIEAAPPGATVTDLLEEAALERIDSLQLEELQVAMLRDAPFAAMVKRLTPTKFVLASPAASGTN